MNPEVIAAFKQDNADPQTQVILMTGRRPDIAYKVREVLRKQGLIGKRMIPNSNEKALHKHQLNIKDGRDIRHPQEDLGHHEYFSGDHNTEKDYPQTRKGMPDGSTLAHKMYIFWRNMTPQIQVVEFWEDRSDHMPHFIKLGVDLLKKYSEENGGKLRKVTIHRVFPPSYVGGQAHVQHIPIKPGMLY